MKALTINGPNKRQAIKQQLVDWIAQRGLEPGDRLASQNELAGRFGVTAVTVFNALRELEEDHVIHREHGRGTFVGPAPFHRRTRTVCLILPGEHLDEPAYNPFFWPYIKSLYRAFMGSVGQQWTFTPRCVATDVDVRKVARELGRFDAVFFHHIKQPRALLDDLLAKQVVPTVAFGLPEPGLRCLTIDHDMVAGTRLAMRHLYGLGYRRIGLIVSPESWATPWQEGYRQALAELGLAYDDRRVVRVVGESPETGARAAQELVARGLPCDAVYVAWDMWALGVVEELRRAGRRVPEDVGVMGYEGLENATHQPPYLASVQLPLARMVRAGLDLIEEAPGRPTPNQHLKFVGEIVPGRTVADRRRAGRRVPEDVGAMGYELAATSPARRSVGAKAGSSGDTY